MTNLIRLVGATIFALSVIRGSNQAAFAREISHVQLLFSEDNKLCQPLRSLYEKLLNIHHMRDGKSENSDFEPNWEGIYSSQFRAIGFKQL